MSYEKVANRVKSGEMSRAELLGLKRNAEDRFADGDEDSREVPKAINHAAPTDSYIVFMGFRPDADFSRRLDKEWKNLGIRRFHYVESEQQVERFDGICRRDSASPKKREKFGRTMKLYGHGRVRDIAYDEDDRKYLKWIGPIGTKKSRCL